MSPRTKVLGRGDEPESTRGLDAALTTRPHRPPPFSTTPPPAPTFRDSQTWKVSRTQGPTPSIFSTPPYHTGIAQRRPVRPTIPLSQPARTAAQQMPLCPPATPIPYRCCSRHSPLWRVRPSQDGPVGGCVRERCVYGRLTLGAACCWPHHDGQDSRKGVPCRLFAATTISGREKASIPRPGCSDGLGKRNPRRWTGLPRG